MTVVSTGDRIVADFTGMDAETREFLDSVLGGIWDNSKAAQEKMSRRRFIIAAKELLEKNLVKFVVCGTRLELKMVSQVETLQ